MEKIRLFLRRHPLLRDALLWVIPALLIGAILRMMILSYSPYAYWGSDSRSYFSFASGVLNKFYFSLVEKRRFLYPIFLVPVSLLPGAPLRWLAWIQAALGLATLLPLAYIIRKVFFAWKLWIIPITVIFAGMPILLWYEHELLAESVFFNSVVWAFAGWVAWISEKDRARAQRLWWWFFVPLAILMLTKPSGRFLVPGIFVGLAIFGAWRLLTRRAVIAGVLLILLTFKMGDDNQAVWLLYTSTFPLTQLDTPLHAEYKAEIRDMVEAARKNLDTYATEDGEAFLFLRTPRDQTARPLWQELGKHEDKLSKVYKDLALEAIKAQPQLFAYISLQRLIGSANPARFDGERFDASYFSNRFQRSFEQRRNTEEMIKLAFGIPRHAPYPPYEYFKQRIGPNPDSRAAIWLQSYTKHYQAAGALVDEGANKKAGITNDRPTALGWWILASALVAMFGPYRRTLGIWTLAMAIYLFGVFLVGVLHPRYFGPAWPVLTLLLPVILDCGLRALAAAATRRHQAHS